MNYAKLSAYYFSQLINQSSNEELFFYQKQITEKSALILDVMCGAGRLLIPLLKAGYLVEGLDYSADMLKLCEFNLQNEKLTTNLYFENLLQTKLDKKYNAITIAMNSFQHFFNQSDAILALKILRNHLLPDGKLFIEMYQPFNDKKGPKKIEIINQVDYKNNGYVQKKTIAHFDYAHRTFVADSQYALYRQGSIVEKENERFKLCWYADGEFEDLMLQAGFFNPQCIVTKFATNPDGMVYIAFTK